MMGGTFRGRAREEGNAPSSVQAPTSDFAARIGVYLFGLMSAAAGIIDIIWREFEPYHQPLQAIGSHIADVKVLVYIGAFGLMAGGGAMLTRRATRYGAATLAIIYSAFAIATLRRFYTAPHYLGNHPSVYIGVFDTFGTQLILVIAALIVYSSRSPRSALSGTIAQIARWAFGICAIDFGLAHLTGINGVAAMIPAWMPLGGVFWTVVSGVAFVLAGIGIVSGLLDILAARLLALMLLIFSFIVLAPLIFAAPHNQVSWGANVYNLTAVASAWITAEWLATQRMSSQAR